MHIATIRDRLVEKGISLYAAPKVLCRFTGNDESDRLLNNLDEYPHAFVIGCIMDRQMKAERAWLIPYHFATKLGTFDISALSRLSVGEILNLMKTPEPLHRFPEEMSRNFHAAIHHINLKYVGVAAKIWSGSPPSAETIVRFLAFRGVGPKIATMAVNILARDFKIAFADYYSVDISADVHVRRVFERLGLTSKDASIEEIIYRARALYPEFPGLLDFPAWDIGRNYCKPTTPICKSCYMNDVCPTAEKTRE